MMTMFYLVIPAVCLLFGWFACSLFTGHRLKKARQEHATLESSLMAQLEAADTQLVAEKGRASRYFTSIEALGAERDRWQRLYTLESIGHGNAQNLLMETISGLIRQLRALGKDVEMPPVIEKVRQEHQQTHELPAREMQNALEEGQKKTPVAPSGPDPTP